MKQLDMPIVRDTFAERPQRHGRNRNPIRVVAFVSMIWILSDGAVSEPARQTAEVVSQDSNSTKEGKSVDPDINKSWKSPDIEPLIGRLEREDREIFQHREELAKLLELRPGMNVADVGSGSGFMTMIFARQVAPDGRVFAVDINPSLLERISRMAYEQGLKNIETVVCPEDSVPLAPESMDMVFVCDTYHHFEHPESSMRSIFRALKAKGRLVLVDFRRIPGVISERLLEHVRAGQKVFEEEISKAGFELIRELEAPFLEQNYVLQFRKRP